MIREIKFRAFHTQSKKMYWFDVLWGNNGHGNGWVGMAPFGEGMTITRHRDNLTNVDITDCEIMQFTGIEDKNGKEIYEGDIVNYAVKKRICRCDGEEDHFLGITKFCPSCGKEVKNEDFVETCEIRFMNGGFTLYREAESGNYYQAWNTFIAETYIEWKEVIGNIHENPELIKHTL